MTDQELHQLATEYAEQNPPADIGDEVLKGNLIGINAEIFEKFLIWLTKTHCIVSQEHVRKHHKGYAFLARKHPKASERHLSEVIIKEIEDIFGKELFEERSER